MTEKQAVHTPGVKSGRCEVVSLGLSPLEFEWGRNGENAR